MDQTSKEQKGVERSETERPTSNSGRTQADGEKVRNEDIFFGKGVLFSKKLLF